MPEHRIGFIGTGIMGAPMAHNLLDAGYTLSLYTRTKARAQKLLDEGAAWADTPADVAEASDVVITCVTDTPDVENVLLGPNGVIGLLVGALITGFAVALMMANSGGAWDNAKKYIEKGELGGKGSPEHKAAVVGDTVGDPFKDTAGPSLNILIKLMSTVSIVFAGFILRFALFK